MAQNDKKLALYASPTKDVLFPNIAALSASQRRFVGWQYSASVGEAGGWIRKTEPDIVAYDNDYLKAVRDGDLVAADFETAQLCGVAFFADIKKVD